MRYLLLIVLSVVINTNNLFGQEKEVGGMVFDSNENPLANVNIRIKGSNYKTKSNNEGYFEIQMNEGSLNTLIFSSIGYATKEVEISFGSISELIIIMDVENTQLTDVNISTGYQTLPKERATGSFDIIDHELFNRQISTDVISRLDGLIPGVLFDKRGGITQRFQVRGISTLATSNTGLADPLIILDNFPYEGDINNINPNDVESITFLKDAAAASIWGAKAGNGVVVITTKKAMYNQGFKLSISSNLTFSEKPNLWYPSQMSTSDYIDTEIFLFDEGAYSAYLDNEINRPIVTPVVEILEEIKAGNLTEEEGNRQIDRFRIMDIRDDYSQYFYRQAFKQQHSMNLTGGKEKLSYLLSTGFDRNLTNLKENEFDRLSFRSINYLKPAKNLEIQLGITYTQSKNQTNNFAPFDLGAAAVKSIYPYAQLADDDGNPTALPQNYRMSFVENIGDGKLYDWKYYPLAEIYQRDNVSKNKDIVFNTSIKYDFLPWLNSEIKYNYQNQLVNLRDLKSEDLFYTRDLINRFTVIQPNDVIYNFPSGSILDYSQSNLQSHNIRGQINIDKNFDLDHQLHAIIGGEVRHTGIDRNSTTVYGYDDYLKIGSQVDYISRHPVFAGLATNQSIPFRDTYSESVNRFVSFYANASYRYLNRYIFSASARRDASNLFGVNTNNKWKPLWSVGWKWDIGKESFYNIEFLPSLSLRATYGYSGNVNNSVPAVVTIKYNNTLSPLGRNPRASLNNPPNADLKWENINQINFAIDFKSKSNTISGNIEYYKKAAKDLIFSTNVDPTTGFTLINKNSAQIDNTGIELLLYTKNLQREVSWNTNLIFSFNKSKLKKILFDVGSYGSIPQGDQIGPPSTGFPLNSLFSYQWHGLDPDTGDPLGYYEGEISKDYVNLRNPSTVEEMYFHGTLLPQYFGSVRNTIDYKGISMSFNISGQFDYYFRRNTIDYAGLFSARGAIGHGDYELRWQNKGDEKVTSTPSLIYPSNSNRDLFYRYSQETVEKGDHIRVQDINLSYFINRRIGSFSNIRVTCYANNLNLILWKATKTNLDPLYNNNIPLTRNIAFGVSTNF